MITPYREQTKLYREVFAKRFCSRLDRVEIKVENKEQGNCKGRKQRNTMSEALQEDSDDEVTDISKIMPK